MEQLMKTLGYNFQNRELLRQALTHSSAGKINNERLEFLGDAVLQQVMSEILYNGYPEAQEGALTTMRKNMVDEVTQSAIAAKIGIGQALIMDHGEDMTGGRKKPKVLCDAMEAVLAAVYLDGGIEQVRRIVLEFWPKPEEAGNLQKNKNYKGELQEFLQKKGENTPMYTLTREYGPSHKKVFEVDVSCHNKVYGHGAGSTIREAEQNAADEALQRLRENEKMG